MGMFKKSKLPTAAAFNIELESLDSLSIGYIVTDVAHNVLLINYEAQELLAVTHTIKTLEAVVRRLPERLALLDHVKYCSVEHKSCSFHEVELGDRKVRVFLSPIFNADELQGNLLTLEDITEKVETEKARDQFLSFLVHELRTPLTAIRGNSALISEYYKEALKDESLREVVVDISSGSEYVLGMVNQFLDMSRLEEGRIAYDMQQFEAVGVLRETTKSLAVIAKERGLTLEFDAPHDLKVVVIADAGRTKQILTNLIGNGLKFTEKGGVRVSLAVKDKQLEISVSDTGAGIPAESRANMFKKYFQAANNKYKHDSSQSTGLGLYVTKLMAEGMGGQIAIVSSAVGKGSTFMFTLDRDNPARFRQLQKQRYDAKQGVEHAQVSEHQSLGLRVAPSR